MNPTAKRYFVEFILNTLLMTGVHCTAWSGLLYLVETEFGWDASHFLQMHATREGNLYKMTPWEYAYDFHVVTNTTQS